MSGKIHIGLVINGAFFLYIIIWIVGCIVINRLKYETNIIDKNVTLIINQLQLVTKYLIIAVVAGQ